MRSDLVDITVIIHYETKRGLDDQGAVKVSDDGNPDKAVWLPKAAIEIERRDRCAVITLPERLANEKGLMGDHRPRGLL